jgi:hypothetical protein
MKYLKTRKKRVAVMVLVIILLIAVPVVLAQTFGDVPADHWAYNQIEWAADAHITAGCGGGNFCPNNNVTRAQMAVFMSNLFHAWSDSLDEGIMDIDQRTVASNPPAIVGRANDGNGVEGRSYGVGLADNGVYGESNSTDSTEAGVKGRSTDSGSGVYGYNTDADAATTASYGVRAYSANGHGVYSQGSTNSGDYGGYFRGYGGLLVEASGGTEPGYGVYVTSQEAEAGYFSATNDDGIRAYGAGTGFYGVYGSSDEGYGVRGNTNVAGGYGLHTSDMIYTGGGCVGCTSMIIAQNGSDATLEPGDVVTVVGIAREPTEFYARPVLLVRKADAASSQGVVGVAEGRYVTQLITKEDGHLETRYEEVADPEGKREPELVPVQEWIVEEIVVEDAHTTTEPAAPGDYLTVVYRGLAQVKVDASAGAIQVGAPLLAAGASGYALAAQSTLEAGFVPAGAIIGKALEPLESGEGLIWVLVDLQ